MVPQKTYALHIASWFPTRQKPFNGDFVLRHITAVAPEVFGRILHVSRVDRGQPVGWEHIDEDNYAVDIRYFRCAVPFLVPVFYLFFYFSGIGKIRRAHGKPVILHVHVLNRVAFVGLLFKWCYRIPLFVTEHWTGYHNGAFNTLGAVRKWAMRRLTKMAYAVLPVTEHLAISMQNHGLRGNYQVVANVVDVEQFTPQKLPEEPFKWIHISHLRDEHKNISGILRVFAKIQQQYSQHELHIVHSHRNSSAEQLAQDLGLWERSVFFHGTMAHKALSEFISTCHALVLFSNVENFPCVIVEAWASGLPVVSSDVGGIAEHLTSALGQLCHPQDEAGLFKAMEHISMDYGSFRKEEIVSYAQQYFSKKAVGKKLATLYMESINNYA